MTKKIKRYSEAFKLQVVSEYEAGSNISYLQKKYGITSGSTIRRWIKKFAKEGFRHELVRITTVEEAGRVKANSLISFPVKKIEAGHPPKAAHPSDTRTSVNYINAQA